MGKETIMDLQEIKTFLEENKEDESVKDFAKSFAPTKESLLEDEEIKKAISQMADSEASRQVDAFKKNKLNSLVEEEVNKTLKQRETKTPEQIEKEELKAAVQALVKERDLEKASRLREANKNKALQLLGEKKLPTKMVDYFVNEEEELTIKAVETFVSMMDEYTSAVKQSIVKSTNIDIADSDGSNTDDSGLTSEQRMAKRFEVINKK